MLMPWTLIGSSMNFAMTMQANAHTAVRTKVRRGLRPMTNRRSKLGAAGVGPSVAISEPVINNQNNSFTQAQTPDFLLVDRLLRA